MDRLAKRLVGGLASLVIGILIFALRSGGGSSDSPPVGTFPDKVFGGGTAVTIEVELSEPGDIHCSFGSGNGLMVNDPKYVRVERPLDAGKHTFVVSVPKQTEVAPEVHIRPPALRKGSRIALVVRRGSEELGKDESVFEHDRLEPGTAFFAQLAIDDAGG